MECQPVYLLSYTECIFHSLSMIYLLSALRPVQSVPSLPFGHLDLRQYYSRSILILPLSHLHTDNCIGSSIRIIQSHYAMQHGAPARLFFLLQLNPEVVSFITAQVAISHA